MTGKYKNLWSRCGVTLFVTDEEAAQILNHEAVPAEIELIVRKVVEEGRFQWDGNSYIPACVITCFNRDNGTDYDDDGEPEWDF